MRVTDFRVEESNDLVTIEARQLLSAYRERYPHWQRVRAPGQPLV